MNFFPILQNEENYSGQKKTAGRRPRSTRPVLNSVSSVIEHTECLWTMVGWKSLDFFPRMVIPRMNVQN